jgi:hypothetical protein
LTSVLAGGEWSASRTGRITPGEKAPGTHWIGGWVGPRAGLDDVEKRKFLILPGLELRPLGRPARSQSLYRLHRKEIRGLVDGDTVYSCTCFPTFRRNLLIPFSELNGVRLWPSYVDSHANCCTQRKADRALEASAELKLNNRTAKLRGPSSQCLPWGGGMAQLFLAGRHRQ